MDFTDILKIHNLNPEDVRLIRHPGNTISGGINLEKNTFYSIWRNSKEKWDDEIRTQLKRTFGKQSHVAHFIGLSNGDTVFTGLYKLIDYEVLEHWPSQKDTYSILHKESLDKLEGNSILRWSHKKIPDFIKYEERLIIDWQSTRSWSQIAGNNPKTILALMKEFEEPKFPGFDEFNMMSNDRSTLPETWKAILSANGGIYLLVHTDTGNQYIGSAYGEDGFFGRWANYEDENNGHGGNKLLKKLQKTIYQISILEICPPSLSDEEVINRDSKWKNKLGSRVFGLNAN